MKIISCILIILTAAFLTGCASWESLSADGAKVKVAAASEVARCELLGSSKFTLPTYQRIALNKPETLGEKITMAARNFAAKIGADTIKPGKKHGSAAQTFQLYMCKKQ